MVGRRRIRKEYLSCAGDTRDAQGGQMLYLSCGAFLTCTHWCRILRFPKSNVTIHFGRPSFHHTLNLFPAVCASSPIIVSGCAPVVKRSTTTVERSIAVLGSSWLNDGALQVTAGDHASVRENDRYRQSDQECSQREQEGDRNRGTYTQKAIAWVVETDLRC